MLSVRIPGVCTASSEENGVEEERPERWIWVDYVLERNMFGMEK